MQRKRAPMSPDILKSKTYQKARYVADIVASARAMENDTKAEARRAAQRCRACFYDGPVLAGAAITDQPCMSCGEVQSYGSTSTDVLCMDCAKTHQLCKKCGADFDLRLDRDDWPAAPDAQSPDD